MTKEQKLEYFKAMQAKFKLNSGEFGMLLGYPPFTAAQSVLRIASGAVAVSAKVLQLLEICEFIYNNNIQLWQKLLRAIKAENEKKLQTGLDDFIANLPTDIQSKARDLLCDQSKQVSLRVFAVANLRNAHKRKQAA